MAANISFTLTKTDPAGDGSTVSYAGHVNIDEYKTEEQVVNALAERMGESKTTIRALAQVIADQIRANAENGNSFSESNLMQIANKCYGSFSSAKGPWVAGVNLLAPKAVSAGATRTAYAGASLTNAVTPLVPRIDNITDNTTHTEGVVKKGDTIYVAGINFSLDSSKSDEMVVIKKTDGTVAATCTVSRSDRMSIDCSFSTDLTAGDYELWVCTRCGQGGDFAVQSAKKSVTVAV